MAETKRKGDLGEAMVMADVLRRGYKVAIPVGEDWKYDLIVLRGSLERVQCKYVESDGHILFVPCRSANNWKTHKYTAEDVDWIACYDKTTDRCYYFPSSLLGEGMSFLTARLTLPKNGQKARVRWAKDFEVF